jgi:uncharacterized repeat protein (TIGR04076 family)
LKEYFYKLLRCYNSGFNMCVASEPDYEWVKPKEGPLPDFFNLNASELEKKVVSMADIAPYKVEATVINIIGRGLCAYGHKIGDTYIFDGDNMEVVQSNGWMGGLCNGALRDLLYVIPRYMWGGYMPDVRGDKDNKVGLFNCGDLKSQVIFQLRRIKKPESPYFNKKGGQNK